MSSGDPEIDFMTVFASAVHDMKNSLNMMLHSIDEIGCDCDASRCRDAQGKLRYEAHRVTADLVQILTIYKFRSSMYPVNIEFQSVPDFLEEHSVEYLSTLERRNIELTVDCPEDLSWFFDGYLIGSLIGNVLNNAIRYTRGRLRLAAGVEDDFLVIRVEDDGGGYPPQMLEQQGQVHQGLSQSSGNTGLGLYFATEVAARHCKGERVGRIALTNGGTYGGGCFALYLP